MINTMIHTINMTNIYSSSSSVESLHLSPLTPLVHIEVSSYYSYAWYRTEYPIGRAR